MTGWSKAQAAMMARRIRDGAEGRAWPLLVPAARSAFVSEYVLMVVFGQEKGAIQVEDIRDLREMICTELRTKHRMEVE